jgi:regulation of enolase protein 1 (concanavalin A-like superfamily)
LYGRKQGFTFAKVLILMVILAMKRYFLTFVLALSTLALSAQSLDRMQWFNEPENWAVKGSTLTMDVTPQSDYWRISHYGFTVDDAPFLYTVRGGEFEAKVKISGEYKVRFDQAGLMLRIDKENYIKAGIEFVDGKYNLSAVVTHKTSDWSVIELDKPVEFVWIKAVRRLDAVEIFYSFDDKHYTMMRNCWMQDNTPVMVGMMAACPDGKGFKAKFEGFSIKHLPDQRRLEWLKKNQ